VLTQPDPVVGRTETDATETTQAARPCVHYVGFRDDRYWNAYRIFGGPRVIHRRWDFYATRDVGPDDIVIFANGDETQPVAERNATDLDERWL
jgi:hypothetical protein